MKTKIVLFTLLAIISISACIPSDSNRQNDRSKPNVVIVYLDDLGYGDIGAYGATEIKTPNFDRLAEGGLRFTDAHSTSATCTPSRYGLLTGVYPWREKNARVLPGTATLLIDTAQITLPKVFKQHGYYTGVVGKWHLGLGNGNINWNQHISPGPNEVGFDYSCILAATQDRVPTVYIENGDVVGLDPNDPIEVSYEHNFEGEPTGRDNPELLSMMYDHGHDMSIVNGIPRIGYMKGGRKALWSDVDMADYFLAKAKDFIQAHKKEPFFLYYALQQPHVPRTPNPRFVGATKLGPRGDVIVEADWCVGEFLNTLENEGLLENTLIIFTSDNGPVLNDGYVDEAVEKVGNHKPAGELRGGKYSLFEAGTRVPLITYWKGRIDPGVSHELVCQIDLLTSLAKLIGSDVSAKDSEDMLDAFLSKNYIGRQNLILEASGRTAYRTNGWAMIPPYERPAVASNVNIELGNSSDWQLFRLDEDLGEQQNVAKKYPYKLLELIGDYKITRELDDDELPPVK